VAVAVLDAFNNTVRGSRALEGVVVSASIFDTYNVTGAFEGKLVPSDTAATLVNFTSGEAAFHPPLEMQGQLGRNYTLMFTFFYKETRISDTSWTLFLAGCPAGYQSLGGVKCMLCSSGDVLLDCDIGSCVCVCL
jgi:hypothetical protein